MHSDPPLHADTYTQSSRCSARFIFCSLHWCTHRGPCAHFTAYYFYNTQTGTCRFMQTHTHTHTVHSVHRSQMMEVRHPPQRKLRVSAYRAQPNHKSCQTTLISAQARTNTRTLPHTYREKERERDRGREDVSHLLCRFEDKREGFGDYKRVVFFFLCSTCFVVGGAHLRVHASYH